MFEISSDLTIDSDYFPLWSVYLNVQWALDVLNQFKENKQLHLSFIQKGDTFIFPSSEKVYYLVTALGNDTFEVQKDHKIIEMDDVKQFLSTPSYFYDQEQLVAIIYELVNDPCMFIPVLYRERVKSMSQESGVSDIIIEVFLDILQSNDEYFYTSNFPKRDAYAITMKIANMLAEMSLGNISPLNIHLAHGDICIFNQEQKTEGLSYLKVPIPT